MSAPLCTVTPLEALRRLYDVARKVDAKESGEFDTLLQGELAVAEAALREAAPAAPTCESCGTHEVELFKLCHNSRCAQYAVQQSVYQGWAKVPAAAPVVPVAAQPVVPEGFQLVPTEINAVLAMGWAYLDAARENDPGQHYSFNHAGWRALLEKAKEYQPLAAPSLEAQPAGEVIPAEKLCALLPGTYYMDPPDGGSVTVLEQVERLAKDAARYRWLIAQTPCNIAVMLECSIGEINDEIDAAIAAQQGEKT